MNTTLLTFPRVLRAVLVLSVSTLLYSRTWDKTDNAVFPVSMSPSDDSVTLTAPDPESAAGVSLAFEENGSGYPGVRFVPVEGETWDFSGYTGLDVTVSSTSEKPIYVTVRVDNPGPWTEKKWNSGAARLVKGDTKRIRIFFGYGPKGPAYPLDISKVSMIQVFTGKAGPNQAFQIDSMTLTKAPVPFRPDVFPPDGWMVNPEGGTPEIRLQTTNGAIASGGNGEPVLIQFTKPDQRVLIRPEGNADWNLNQGYRIRARIRNLGDAPVSPGLFAASKEMDTEIVKPESSIPPGEAVTLTVSWLTTESTEIVHGQKKRLFDSNDATAFVIVSDESGGPQKIELSALRLEAPPVDLPAWVGNGPLVPGDWALTFADEFDGSELDRTRWNVHTPNYWDKISRFSKDNVYLEDGKAVLKFEKRTGPHNDDPDHPRKNDYTTGFLDTYGKWVQRYGYFETRIKIPAENGLWPAFWLMPDRGMEAGPQWRRANIAEGGMEFDILEYLSGWGPYRFTTAYHWDGYGENHKATGAGVFTGHDEEGFITSGLLWLPGLAVVYTNGVETSRWETDRISEIQSYIIYTFVAGGWDNTPLNDKELPAFLEIDYVRVWQRADLASEVDGVQSTQPTLAAPTVPDSELE